MLNKDENYCCFFNGDADGVFSVLQFILSGFSIYELFTGPKRDQNLLRHAKKLGAQNVLVFDLELAKNQDHLREILEKKYIVTWFDHHGNNEERLFSTYPNFTSLINTDSNVNTSLIVNNFLDAPELMMWVIAGLFGDNLDSTALHYCKKLRIPENQTSILSDIGKLVNYNSYGKSLEELIFHPSAIINHAKMYPDPITFYNETAIIQQLQKQLSEDFALALSYYTGENIVFLPNTPWALRSYGILGNYLVNLNKEKYFAILVEIDPEYYLISIRSPLSNPRGAGNLCRQFPTGGGRESAGGINKLGKKELERFITALEEAYCK